MLIVEKLFPLTLSTALPALHPFFFGLGGVWL